MTTLFDLPTPALLLDVEVLDRNLHWMAQRCEELGVSLRPHIKTHKCIEIGQRQRDRGAVGITVATLQEAREFAARGFDDITWAFPVILSRLDEIRAVAEDVTLRVVVDSSAAIDGLERLGTPLHVWLKVDCGYHRAGVSPTSPIATDLANRLVDSGTLQFDGILTHSGHAYYGPTREDVLRVAHEERDVMVEFAEELRAAGVSVPAISIGSTPAMRVIDRLDGVDETRPGNYVFYDYTQMCLGNCQPDECALTVLASVVSSRPDERHAVVDAGALALSKDPGRGDIATSTMGEIFDEPVGSALSGNRRLVSLSQEHGVAEGSFAVGDLVRILPNHSCLTAACFDEYHVIQGDTVVDRWTILRRR